MNFIHRPTGGKLKVKPREIVVGDRVIHRLSHKPGIIVSIDNSSGETLVTIKAGNNFLTGLRKDEYKPFSNKIEFIQFERNSSGGANDD